MSAREGDLQAQRNWTTPLISEAINDCSSGANKISGPGSEDVPGSEEGPGSEEDPSNKEDPGLRSWL